MKIIEQFNNYTGSLSKTTPFTNVYGLGRTILALGLLLTLLANGNEIIFPNSGIPGLENRFGLFHLMEGHLVLAKLFAIIALLLVASGWRPRFTGVLHWWVAYSFYTVCPIIDGGDQINALLALLLIPVTMMDGRKWHWAQAKPIAQQRQKAAVLIAWGMFFLIRLQVAFIYLHAAIAKLEVREWVDGTAVYYWSTHPQHGMNDFWTALLLPLLSNTYFVTALTWGTLLLELMLFTGVMLHKSPYKRKALLLLGLSFHFAIIIMHGLVSFYFTMAGALILYLYPVYEQISFFPSLKQKFLLRKKVKNQRAAELELVSN